MTVPNSDPARSSAQTSQAPVRRGAAGKWGWIAGLVILALIAAFVFTRDANKSTSTAAPPAVSTAPASSGASISPAVTSQPPSAANQASPQGPTGPINTESGGAPANSPQGETPPGMQSAPQGSQAPAPSEQSQPTR